MKSIIAIGLTIFVLALTSIIIRTNDQVELKQLDIRTKQAEINDLNKQIEELEDSETSNSKRIRELKKKNEQLQSDLQSKHNREALERSRVVYAASVPQYSGDWVEKCHIWAKNAGISLNSWAIELIKRESKCNPSVWNHGGSGACGIPQALPCSKLSNGINTSPEEQLLWMRSYVISRYGSWQKAVEFHNINNWY